MSKPEGFDRWSADAHAYQQGYVAGKLDANADNAAHSRKKDRAYFAAHADVSVYAPSLTLTYKLGRDVTVAELADYVAEIRSIEADALIAALEKEQGK